METARIREIDSWIGSADVKKPASRAVGAERAIVPAIGAPQDGGETTALRDCPGCGERTGQEIERPSDDADALVTICVDCGTETGRFT